MRADRLVALVLLLQSRGRITASRVASELGVSLATVRRDLEALAAAGIPVQVQAGRGGGWQLVGGARTNLTGLSGHEARALFWMLGTAGLADPETRVATMKLIQALPQSMRTEAERLATSIHYDHAPWGEPPGDPGRDLGLLRRAVVGRRVLTGWYTARSGQRWAVRLRPLGLVAKAGAWYLVADGDPGPRTYRVSRLDELSLADEEFDAPAGFDLAAFWGAHAEEIERERSVIAARLRVPTWVAPHIQQQFGRYCTVLGQDGEHATIEVRARLLVALAEQLAGWGDRIEVLAPEELRGELVRLGADVVRHHGSAPQERLLL